MIEQLKRMWEERLPRERAIIAIGGGVVAIAILYLMLIDPAWSGLTRLEKTLPAQRKQAAELETLLSEVKSLRARPQVATVSAADARGALETSIKRAGMKASRITPLSDGDLQLTFADVPYGTWAPWLASAERELGAHTSSVTVTGKPETPGNVDVEMALRLARK